MTDSELINAYFEWMYQLVCDDFNKRLSFRKLLARLYDADFQYSLPMDENRETDGIRLRYRFGRSVRTTIELLRLVWTIDRAAFWK